MDSLGLGGNGSNPFDVIINLLHQNGVEIDEVEDQREKVDLQFAQLIKIIPATKFGPKGHVAEGESIELRDYQVEVINNFLKISKFARGCPLVLVRQSHCPSFQTV